MKLVINGIERECTILPAPKGVFFMEEGCFVVPQYIAIAQTEGQEKRYSSTLICPIDHHSGGYINITPGELHNELNRYIFEKLICEYVGNGFTDSNLEAAEYIYDSMCIHGVAIRPGATAYLNELREKESAKEHND